MYKNTISIFFLGNDFWLLRKCRVCLTGQRELQNIEGRKRKKQNWWTSHSSEAQVSHIRSFKKPYKRCQVCTKLNHRIRHFLGRMILAGVLHKYVQREIKTRKLALKSAKTKVSYVFLFFGWFCFLGNSFAQSSTFLPFPFLSSFFFNFASRNYKRITHM